MFMDTKAVPAPRTKATFKDVVIERVQLQDNGIDPCVLRLTVRTSDGHTKSFEFKEAV